ncbi:MAG: hypothetical protein LR011_07030 [Verrucomicrobia bacterium]|nr:hypothetical protein [Verrucomicrobiota bacterium]
MNSLRFGSLESAEVRRLFRGVVAGIAHYGNCFGVPTIAGESPLTSPMRAILWSTPLLWALCILTRLRGGQPGALAIRYFMVGPATGRDGLAGAAFASQDLTDASAEQQRGAVQVGDPFMEKLVMEACLELLATGRGRWHPGYGGLPVSPVPPVKPLPVPVQASKSNSIKVPPARYPA